jgi:hypothetical protein
MNFRIPRWNTESSSFELSSFKIKFPDFKILDTKHYLWYYSPSEEKSIGWFGYFYFYSESKQTGKVKILREPNFWKKLLGLSIADIYKDCVM